MKNLFKKLMLVAVAAMAFTACTETNDEVNVVKRDNVLKFTTSFADTRVTIGTEKNDEGAYPVTWDGDEDVRFDIQDGGWWTNLESEMFIDSEDARNASFEVILSGYAENASADAGSTIYAYFGKLTGSRVADIAGQTQTPQLNGVDKSFISMVAEFPVEVEGQLVYSGTFHHKTAFGWITLPEAVEAVEFSTVTIKVNNSKEYVLNVAGLEAHSYWFACEPESVSSISVSAVDAEGAIYGYTVSGLSKTFVAGTVSKFSIKDLTTDVVEPVQLNTPVVTSNVSDGVATFTWEAVENASSYAVSINYGEYVNVGEVLEYVVNLSSYAPFSTLNVQVKAVGTGLFLDSDSASNSVSVPVTKESNGDSGFDFAYDSAELRGTNKYKFYNSAESNKYMYVSFDRDITALEPGSYTYKLGSGVNGGTADSAYRHPNYTNGSYVEYWFQGEFVAYVDVATDGVYSITVFCKRWVENGEYLFKGYWSGVIPTTMKLATPQNLNAAVAGSTINVSWSYVSNATSYEVSINGEADTTTNTYYSFIDVEPGDYIIEVVAKADGYEASSAASTGVTVKEVQTTSGVFENASFNYNDSDKIITFTSSTLGSLKLNFYPTNNNGANYITPGVYTLNSDNGFNIYYAIPYTSYTPVGGSALSLSYARVEVGIVDQKYNISFEIQADSYAFTATYVGIIEGLSVPVVDSGDSGDSGDGGDSGTTEINRFVLNYLSTWDETEIKFFLNDGTYDVICIDIPGAVQTKTYSISNGSILKNYSFVQHPNGNEVLTDDIELNVTVNGDGTYTFSGHVVTTTNTYYIDITGTPAIG